MSFVSFMVNIYPLSLSSEYFRYPLETVSCQL